MAGNKNPWRDICTLAEWNQIKATVARDNPRRPPAVNMGGHRGRGGPAFSPMEFRQGLTAQITAYHSVAKDDHNLFPRRINYLRLISVLCEGHQEAYSKRNHLGAKTNNGHKSLTDTIDVWVRSLGKRAGKKADYLETMKQWHDSAKAKYTDRTQMSIYLRNLARSNVRNGGSMLHVTGYATVEKIDPYHRQAFFFLDPDDANYDQAVQDHLMGEAFYNYIGGVPPAQPDPCTNANPSFYEWLEYHPFCLGTPGVQGDARFKQPPRISYEGLDLARAVVEPRQIWYERIISDPGFFQVLDTTTFRVSGKGPAGGAAFVWDRGCNLWLHAHGHDGFIHASAKTGQKIRCSGMIRVRNGLAEEITNQSGHYAPGEQQIYYFLFWLRQRKALAADAHVTIEHGQVFNGRRSVTEFIGLCKRRFSPPQVLPYPAQ